MYYLVSPDSSGKLFIETPYGRNDKIRPEVVANLQKLSLGEIK